MEAFESRIRIERPVMDVWVYVTDLPRTPLWRTTVRTVTAPSALGVGQSFTASTRVLGRTWEWVLEITALEPPNRFTYAVVHGVAPLAVEYRLDDAADGCDFALVASVDAVRLPARVLEPIAGRVLRRETVRHLANLKRILEAGSDGD